MSISTEATASGVGTLSDTPEPPTIPGSVTAHPPGFPELQATPGGPPGRLDKLLDVSVTVTAELGRVHSTVGDILKLAIGSVFELDRPISEPIDLVVQGVALARGEVMVVDDQFAIRITEILSKNRH